MKQFIFEYDLGIDMNPLDGKLIFAEDGSISNHAGDSELFRFFASEITEAVVKAGVGCGLLFVKAEGKDDRILCRFTMTGLKQAGEFCKIVNFFINNGTAAFPEKEEKRYCEECGRPMVSEINVCVFCYSKLGIMKRALGFAKPYMKQITISQLFGLIPRILFMLSPLFIRHLVNNFLEPRTGVWSDILLIAGGMLAIRVVADAVQIVTARVFNKATIAVTNDLRVHTYAKLQGHSMSLFAKRTPGDLIRRIMDDTSTINEFVSDLGRWIVDLFFNFVIAFAILLYFNWQLTLLVFLPVPIVIFALRRFWGVMMARFERHWRQGSRCNSILHDIIKGIRTVKSFGNEEREIAKFSRATRRHAKIGEENEILWSLLFPPIGFIMGVGEFLILFVGGWMVLNGSWWIFSGDLLIGDLVLFTMYLGFIYGPLRWMVHFPRWLANTTTSMVKVFEVLDDESELKPISSPHNVPITGNVHYDGVFFGYKSYEPVLKNITVDIKPGEMIGLVGKSGVGKSTMINLAMRLYDPNTGKIKINDTDLRDIDSDHLHENMGVVFQDSFLFAGSFYENIVYGKPDATFEEVIAASKAANAHDFITQTSDGYNTYIGEGGQNLSGGERQRLSIARAIIKNPDILILDEATSSLDVETEASIQESLNRITQGRTTIAIAHRLSTLRNADRLVVLAEGGVEEVGTHAELLKKKGMYYNLVMAQRQNSRKQETTGG
ncbi:MAG: ABC transporter ATP-binding protein/permease [Defluviitaleaceae bacterium]|nr:ABC transporter ATP-binding protein/permease [Defluviitaleaceae bacterium]MCL2238423.1 ABC transporter ATP-binding protein/permease [Defluviitaleaceae bacterium]